MKPSGKKSLGSIAVTILVTATLSLSGQSASAITYGQELIDAKTLKPWVASIWELDPEDGLYAPICSGSLISEDVVLTAAHCLSESKTYTVQIRADTLFQDGELLKVSAIWTSPRYDERRIQNDLGLLLLTTPVTDVEPIKLATKKQTKQVDAATRFTAYGWGLDQNKKLPTFLRYSELREQKKAAQSFYSKRQFNAATTIAAGKYLSRERVYSGACNGDSGGPLVAMIRGVETLVGITSYGARSCRTKAPSVFTKISYYEKDITNGVLSLRARAALGG